MNLPKPPRLTKTDLKQNFWLAIECDYVEHGVGPTDLSKKFQVSRRSVVRHAKAEQWKKKREDFREVRNSLEKRRERERSETFHERNQLMASSLQSRVFRLFLEEQDRLQLKAGDENQHVDTFSGLQERASTLNSFAQIGQAVGYGPPEPPPPPRVDYRVIINANQITSRKFDPEAEVEDDLGDPIEMAQEDDEGTFVPYVGIGNPNEDQ